MNPSVAQSPRLSIIIVSYNTCALLRECLQAVFRQTADLSFEVIVVDNASHDGSQRMVREEFPAVRLFAREDNVGFGVGNNVGVEAARGRYLLLLNSDAVLLENTSLALVNYLDGHPDVACIGPRIVWEGGRLQPKAFGHLPSPWRMAMQSFGLAALGLRCFEGVDGIKREGREMDVGWLSGVCLCLRRDDYLAVGGFDPRFFMYAEDVALCAHLRHKGRIVLVDRFDVLHYGGRSSANVAARVRNAVWQQRHILQVCADEYGRFAQAASKVFIAAGLVLRILAALALIPRKGLEQNMGLRTGYARLVDLFGLGSAPVASKKEGGL